MRNKVFMYIECHRFRHLTSNITLNSPVNLSHTASIVRIASEVGVNARQNLNVHGKVGRNRESEIQKYRDTEIERYRYRNTEIQR